MNPAERIKELEQELSTLRKAFVDVLDGSSAAHEIQNSTGLPDERCEEISVLYSQEAKKLYS